jgi:hypothetical protein
MKKIAILQSNYIPWKGYFDLIASVDEFIIYDDMQYTKNDWRNRNIIKTPKNLEWITIPCGIDINRRIRDVLLPLCDWQRKHLKMFESNYKKAEFYNEIFSLIEPVYLDKKIKTLTEFNRVLIVLVCNYLNIKTKISYSWDYTLGEGKTERLINLCKQTKAQIYVSGLSAKNYLDEELFINSQIGIEWFDYNSYKEYPQLWGSFEHNVTVLDLLFNCGKNSSYFMRFSKKDLI